MKPDNTLKAHSLQQQSTRQQQSTSEVPMQLHQQISPRQVQQISPSSEVPMQLQDYNAVVDSRMFQQPLIQNQQHNQTPLLVQRLPQQQMPRDVQNQVVDITNQRKKASICVFRLMQYMKHQRRRPPDNNINYWRKFVRLYYSPFAKKRWCLSMTPNESYRDIGINSWKCELCGSNSGKGFEIYCEALPRMYQIYFNSAVINELLYLEAPYEVELPSGFMMLTFEKAVVDSVYKHFRVVHEGKLCILFTPELKIISWEFCIRSHEDLVSRRFVADQVNESVKSAAKCLSKTKLKESEGFPEQDLLSDCHRIVAEGKNLTENLKSPLIDGFGFPKQFVRCVQMVEVLNSMKNLMIDNQTNNSSPIETLKRYHQPDANEKVKRQKCGAQMQQTPNADRSNFQVDRCMTQTTNAREQQVMFNPSNYHQNSMMEEQRITLDSNQISHDKPFSSMPYQHLNSSENSFLGPSPALKDLNLKRQINDILMSMHAKRIQGNCSDDGGVVLDPIEDEELNTIFGEEASTLNRLDKHIEQIGGIYMSDKGKRCNYSSSSNSTPRIIFTDNCMLKKDTNSDDGTTSAPSHQQVEEQ